MKMVKSLLLGAAAGFVAVAGAQAADLPVKAKPVQYVKICSLYGAGFYYMPGTDTCIKIGGFVRAEYNINSGGSFAQDVNDLYNRSSNLNTARARALLTADVRSQTEYGTLRAYLANGIQSTNSVAGSSIGNWSNRAFIQIAGFTAGLAASFFDFFELASVSNQTNIVGSESGGGGILVFAYTAQFGNGLSASIAAEDNSFRRTAVWRSDTAITQTGGVTNNYGGTSTVWPDLVANLRIDQAWGSAQVMGAIHQVTATYYAATEASGSPGNEVGFAVGGGLKFNLPMLGKGDFVGLQANYAEGATTYNFSGFSGGPPSTGTGFGVWSGQQVALGFVTDAVYSPAAGTAPDLQLTESWSVTAGFQHNWTPKWKSSIYGGYGEVNYNNTAAGLLNTAVCGTTTCGNPDFSYWHVGSRTVFTPVQNLDLSVDVLYSNVNTGYSTLTNAVFSAAPKSAGVSAADQDILSAIVRMQRNFYP